MRSIGFGQTIAQLGKVRQLRGQFTFELLLLEAPTPVAAVQAGSVHAGVTAETEHVLQGNDAQTGRGTLCRAAFRNAPPS